MFWFGESWGAPLCDDGDQIDVPVGKKCASCDQRIERLERGVVLPYGGPVVDDLTFGMSYMSGLWVAYHIDCFLTGILGPGPHDHNLSPFPRRIP